MKNKIILPIYLALAFLPISAIAQQLTGTETFFRSVARIISTILIPLVMTVALLLFFWGLVMYIRSVSPGSKEEGKSIMIWGIVALFVMTSVWGIVRLIRTELGINQNGNIEIPGFGGSTSGGSNSGGGAGTYQMGP